MRRIETAYRHGVGAMFGDALCAALHVRRIDAEKIETACRHGVGAMLGDTLCAALHVRRIDSEKGDVDAAAWPRSHRDGVPFVAPRP